MHLILFPLGEMKKCRLNLRAGLELPPITVPEEADLIGLVETKVRSGKEKLYRGLSQAVTVAVLFVILHDSFRSKLAKQGQRGSESEGARLSIEEAVNSGS